MAARQSSLSSTASHRFFRWATCGRSHAFGRDRVHRCRATDENATAVGPHSEAEHRFEPPVEGRVFVGRYLLGRRLGRGAFAVVHAATDLRMDREVAVKLGPSPEADQVLRRRFLREAQMMARVGNPGTVVVYDYGTLPLSGHAFIVMERLHGETLRQRMERGLPMPLEEARDIIGEVLMTLSAFHARGMIHRDLKPENIFLHQATPGERVVKVLDFGFARLEDESNLVTEPWEVLGTPLYMAPELFRGTGIGHRADLFAVATMLFEMLAGEAPLEREPAESLLAFLSSSVRTTRRRLRTLRPDLPVALDEALARALELDDERRHEDARELLCEILLATGGVRALADSSKSWRLSCVAPSVQQIPGA